MAQDIQIEVTQNVVEIDTTTNVIEVNTETSVVKIHNADGLNGKDGKDGVDGKSAYEQAVEGGFVGTEQEFINSLNNLNEIKNIMPLVYAGL